jgi:hypothetical protein
MSKRGFLLGLILPLAASRDAPLFCGRHKPVSGGGLGLTPIRAISVSQRRRRFTLLPQFAIDDGVAKGHAIEMRPIEEACPRHSDQPPQRHSFLHLRS